MEFEQIYRVYFSDVWHYVRRLSGDPDLAEEITAETFFRAMKAIDRFRGDCDVRVWLCQIAKNCYFSHLKRQKKGDTAEKIRSLDDSPEEMVLKKDSLNQAHRLLHELPDTMREVFMWRTYGELSFGQIGELFGKSANWACVTYHRARASIRKAVEEEEHE